MNSEVPTAVPAAFVEWMQESVAHIWQDMAWVAPELQDWRLRQYAAILSADAIDKLLEIGVDITAQPEEIEHK